MINFFHLIQLAWKNIWRRKARTIISISSLWFTMTIIIFSKSMMDGTYGHMIENTIHRFVSYIQIHDENWLDEKTLSNSMNWNSEQDEILNSEKNITAFSKRIRTGGLISFGEQTRGAQIIGIAPENESKVTNFHQKVKSGNFLENDTTSNCLIGDDLAEKMKIGIGDTLVIMSYDRFGTISATLSPVAGILNAGDPQLDGFTVFISIGEAEMLTSLNGKITEIAINISNESNLEKTVAHLQDKLPAIYDIAKWEKISPEALQMIAMDKASGIFSMILLLLIVGFGILNTIYMSIMERTHEFGILQAIGVYRISLSSLVFVEIIVLLGIAGLISTIGSIPAVLYLANNPILLSGAMAEVYEDMGFAAAWYFEYSLSPFLIANVFVIGSSLILSIFPLMKMQKMRVVEALRNV
ncbi:ABC transporter permease [bacterium]|nr:ABC transporter permease [bacterium]